MHVGNKLGGTGLLKDCIGCPTAPAIPYLVESASISESKEAWQKERQSA